MRTISIVTIVAAAHVYLGGHCWAQTVQTQAAPALPTVTDGSSREEGQNKTPAPASPNMPAPASVTVIDSGYARGILGRDVRSPTDENMGRIADIIVDRGGQVRAAVIDFGGFLGVGSRKIVVDWSALHFSNVAEKGESTTLELTRDQVKEAPEYKEDKPIIVLGASGRLEPMRFRLLTPNE